MQSLWGQGKWETLWSSLMRRVQGILQEVHQKAGRYVSNLVISQESFKLSNVTHSNSMPNSSPISCRNLDYVCKESGNCIVDVTRRNQCQSCRFKKCLQVNMKKEGKVTVYHIVEGLKQGTHLSQAKALRPRARLNLPAAFSSYFTTRSSG